MDTREVVLRFETERQALALMDHPAIAKVFDAGSTSQGRPFFAMEFVSGKPITIYCDENKLTLRERAKLFIRVCEAVQHAHQKAIIHRDLKPSNILVTEVDGRPVPKIIDFGVARATGQRLTAETFFTREGAIVGTPDYMSPEQACLTDDQMDTRTDVYSLGVVLYELLVGVLPLDFRRLAFDQILRKLREEDPSRPSSRLIGPKETTVPMNRSSERTALMRQLRGDLDCIVLKPLQKNPERRYDSAAELAADLGRFLANRPVEAHPPGFAYQTLKYCRRHYVAAASAGLILILAAVLAIVQNAQLRRVTRERDRADRIAAFLSNIFKVSNPGESRGNQVTAREILDKASIELNNGLPKDPLLQADMMDVMGDVYESLGLFPQSEALLRRALKIHQSRLGAADLATARSLHSLSCTLFSEGRLAEAEKLEGDALLIRQRELGPEHPETLRSMNNIARIVTRTGRRTEAERIHHLVLATRQRVLGAEHPETLMSMDNLGSVLDDEGRYDEAESLEREALNIRMRTLGEDHPDTLHSLHHLADTEYDAGRFTEAEKLHREELSVSLRVLGPEHAETLNAMVGLANALDDEGRFVEAESINRRAMETELRVIGPQHYNALIAMNNEAEILDDEGRHSEAAELHRRVLQIRTQILGENHSDTLYSMSKLAWSLTLMHQLPEAETLSRRALEKQIRVLGPDHPDAAETRYNLACIAAQRGQVDEAIRQLSAALHQGLKPREMLRAARDSNLKVLGNDPRYASLLAFARERASVHSGR